MAVRREARKQYTAIHPRPEPTERYALLPRPTDDQRRRVAAGVPDPDPDPDPERVDRAAHLLAGLEAAGQALGVDPEGWRAVTSRPMACWDVTR